MAASTYCDLPRELDIVSRLTLSEHIIDAFSRELNDTVTINSSTWRREANGYGAYIYATVTVFDTRNQTTSRGIRFRVTDTYLGIQGGSADASRFSRGGDPPADAPLAPAADIPQLAEFNRELKRVSTPIITAARTQDSEEALSLLDPATSRLGAINFAQLGELQRHAPDPLAQTSTTSAFRYPQTHGDSASESTEPANTQQSRLRRVPILAPSYTNQRFNRRPPPQPAQTGRQPRPIDLQAHNSSFGSPVDAPLHQTPSTSQLLSLRQNLASTFRHQTPIDLPTIDPLAPPPVTSQAARHLFERPAKRARSEPPPLDTTFLPDNHDDDHNDAADSTHQQSGPVATDPPSQPERLDSQQRSVQVASEPLTASLPRIAHALAAYLPCTAEDLLAAMLGPPPSSLISFYDAQCQNAPNQDRTGRHGRRET